MLISVIIRWFFIVVSCAGLIAFGLPFFAHVHNIGNILGFALSMLLLIVSLFPGRVMGVIAQIMKTKGGSAVVAAGAVLAAAGVMIAAATAFCIIHYAAREPASDATGLILGCQVKGEVPSLSLKQRMDAAYDWMMKNPDACCILSGGQGKGEEITEAECMYRYLTEKGIRPDRLFLEDRSASTYENLLFSDRVAKENGLNEVYAVITHEYHEYRALYLAEKMDLAAGAVPAKTSAWLLPTFFVREQIAVLHEWILNNSR